MGSLCLIGLSATIAQIVLMRELMVVFYGNEVSLGVMLATWLLWTAVGSNVCGRLAARAVNPAKVVAYLQTLLAFIFPATILALRVSRGVLQALPGEVLAPVPTFLTCLATLSLLCMVSGCLFVAGSRLYAHVSYSASALATGSVYLLEAAGSAFGGILASIVLVRWLGSIEIALLVGLLNLLAAIGLGMRTRSARAVSLGILLALFAFAEFFASRRLEMLSLARLWPGFQLVTSRSSIYGNLAIVGTKGTRSLFENGLLMFNADDPAVAEESVHFALLEHPAPKSLLLIGGGPSGSLAQALQHPSLQRVDYVELDPTVLDLADQYFSGQWAAARTDPRIHLYHADGRLFAKSASQTYDVIIVNLPAPQTAQLNRFYTSEFFREAAEKLTPSGVLSFQLPAGEEYISPELAAFLQCVNRSVRDVFPEVATIPGETVHFFAAKQPGVLTSNSAELLARLRSRQLQTRYVREYYLPFRMAPDRMEELAAHIRPQSGTPANRDLMPIAYYFDIVLWSTQFNQAYRQIFLTIAQVSFRWLAIGTAILLALAGTVVLVLPRPNWRVQGGAGFCVAVSGLTMIGLEILLLLVFQAIYGYVYHQLALLIAFFMAGMALGAAWRLARAKVAGPIASRRQLFLIAGLQIVAALAPILLYFAAKALGQMKDATALGFSAQVLFPALVLISGLLGGYEFVLATQVFFSASASPDKNLGTLYSLDLLGACLGAVAISAFLFPVFGLLRTAMLISLANLFAGIPICFLGFSRSSSGGAAPQGLSAS